jgi:hypothetical protein
MLRIVALFMATAAAICITCIDAKALATKNHDLFGDVNSLLRNMSVDSLHVESFQNDSATLKKESAFLAAEFGTAHFSHRRDTKAIRIFGRDEKSWSTSITFYYCSDSCRHEVEKHIAGRRIGSLSHKVWNRYVWHSMPNQVVIVESRKPENLVERNLNTFLFSQQASRKSMDENTKRFFRDTVSMGVAYVCNFGNGVLDDNKMPLGCDTKLQGSDGVLMGMVDVNGKAVARWMLDTTSKDRCVSLALRPGHVMTIDVAVGALEKYLPEVQRLTADAQDLMRCRYNYGRAQVRIMSENTNTVSWIVFHYPQIAAHCIARDKTESVPGKTL